MVPVCIWRLSLLRGLDATNICSSKYTAEGLQQDDWFGNHSSDPVIFCSLFRIQQPHAYCLLF